MRMLCALIVLSLAAPAAVWAFKDQKEISSRGGPALEAQPPPMAALPELKGVVSWKTLAEVTPVKEKDRFVPQFSKAITALDKKEVKLQGFMLPLDMGEKQKRFILTALPPSCAFCLPGGPDQLVEVQARTPVKYGFEPIVVSGRLSVLRDDPMGLYYRLTDAEPITR